MSLGVLGARDADLCPNRCGDNGQCVYGGSGLPYCECTPGHHGSDCAYEGEYSTLARFKTLYILPGTSKLYKIGMDEVRDLEVTFTSSGSVT